MAFVVILIVVGILLLLAEVLIIPGMGVAGILGLLSMGASCFYAFSQFGNVAGIIVTSVNVVLAISLLVYVLRAKTWKKLALNTKIDSKVNIFDETKLAVGDRGKALTRLCPIGEAMFQGKKYEVKSLEGIIDSGTEVEVVLIEENRIFVKPLQEDF